MWRAFKRGDDGINIEIPLSHQPDAEKSEIDFLSILFDIENLSLNELRSKILVKAMLKNEITSTGDQHEDLLILEEFYRKESTQLLGIDINSDWETIVSEFEGRVDEALMKLDPIIRKQCIQAMDKARDSAIALQDKNKFIAQWEVLLEYVEG